MVGVGVGSQSSNTVRNEEEHSPQTPKSLQRGLTGENGSKDEVSIISVMIFGISTGPCGCDRRLEASFSVLSPAVGELAATTFPLRARNLAGIVLMNQRRIALNCGNEV